MPGAENGLVPLAAELTGEIVGKLVTRVVGPMHTRASQHHNLRRVKHGSEMRSWEFH